MAKINILGTRASKIIRDCQNPKAIIGENKFLFGIEQLDGSDPLQTFMKNSANLSLSRAEYDDFLKDRNSLNPWHTPGVWTEYVDLPKHTYYMKVDERGVPIMRDGAPIYVDFLTEEEINWSELSKKREKKPLLSLEGIGLNIAFPVWFRGKKQKRMILAPTRYLPIKNALFDYVDYVRKTNTMTTEGYDLLESSISLFFNRIETGRYRGRRREKLYDIVDSERSNHRFLLASVAKSKLDKMLSNESDFEYYVGYDLSGKNGFRELSEAIAIFANQARGGYATVVDALGPDIAKKIYGQVGVLLYKEDGNSLTKKNRLAPHDGIFTKSYFMSLSVSEQINQIRSALGDKAPNINKIGMMMKIRLGNYLGSHVLRAVNFFGHPAIYSLMMTFGAGLSGFMPLLTLNSSMFVVDHLVRKNKLNGDWGTFLRKFSLDGGVNLKYLDGENLPYTLGEFGRDSVHFLWNQMKQGLFNVGDSLMENHYRVTQIQRFMETMFPGIESLYELTNILERFGKEKPSELEQLLDAARAYTENSVRNLTTNTNLSASLARVRASKDPTYQPWVDTYYTMWNFFSGWGWNKLAGAFDIVKAGVDGVFSTRIGAEYLNNALIDPVKAKAILNKRILDIEDFSYFLNKIYMSLLIGKVIQRLGSDDADEEDTFMEELSEILYYTQVFESNTAAFGSTPQGAIINAFFSTLTDTWDFTENKSVAFGAAATATGTVYLKKFFRKLFMGTQFIELLQTIRQKDSMQIDEVLPMINKVIRNSANGYLHFLKEEPDLGGYKMYMTPGPNYMLRRLAYLPPKDMEKLYDLKNAQKYFSIFYSELAFENRFKYTLPFAKQRFGPMMKDTSGFLNDLEEFGRSDGYNKLINGHFPSDMTDEEYVHLYNIVSGFQVKDKDKIDNDTLYVDYSFEKDGETIINRTRQSQERLLHLLMSNGLSEEEIEVFKKNMKDVNNKVHNKDNIEKNNNAIGRKEAAIRTLAYIEAKQPGSSIMALSYYMGSEWFRLMYKEGEKVDYDENKDAFEKKSKKVSAYLARKYGELLFEADKNFSWNQVMLLYGKNRYQGFSQWVSEKGEHNNKILKIITPETDKSNNKLVNIFKAKTTVDIMSAMGDVNAHKLANMYSLIFDVNKYAEKDGLIKPEIAAFNMKMLNYVYDYIDQSVTDESEKHHLKMGTFMFGDKLFASVMKDPVLSEREDVKETLHDWVHYFYGELKEINELTKERIEDDFTEKKRGKKKGFRSSYKRFRNKENSFGLFKWRDRLKNKAYSDNYVKYRVPSHTPRFYQKDYLKESEYLAAKRAIEMAGVRSLLDISSKNQKHRGGTNNDSGILSVGRRGKSIANYVREDIDKPVEYKTPWRKRWVRKGKGVAPISTTTWKHLTPKPRNK